MGDIARSMNCDASYVTALVDALEQPGLAERQVAAHDRRVKTIHLTPDGHEANRRAHDMLAEPPPQMKRLDADETAQLARLLEKLTD
jgi:DNA-binding MarR family transcriptional regulator